MRSRWFGPALLLATIAVSIALWPTLPERVVTHWNLRGEPDGWSSPFWAAVIGPGAVALVLAAFRWIPRIDPRRANYARFRDTYRIIAHGVALIIAVIHVGVLAGATGVGVDVLRVATGGIGATLILLGNVMGRLQPNWFLGIRTPWTMDDPEVWRKTHRASGWLFVAAGLVTAAGALLRPGIQALAVAGIATLGAVIASAAASFIYWNRERRP